MREALRKVVDVVVRIESLEAVMIEIETDFDVLLCSI